MGKRIAKRNATTTATIIGDTQQQAHADAPEASAATDGQPVTRSCHQNHQVVVEDETNEEESFAAVSASQPNAIVEANAGDRLELDNRRPPTAALVRTMISPSSQSDTFFCVPMLTLDKNIIKIGRDSKSDLLILDLDVSRTHTIITWEQKIVRAPDGSLFTRGDWYIVDQSTNGVWLDGERLAKNRKTRLVDGMTIRLPNCEFVFIINIVRVSPDVAQDGDHEMLVPVAAGAAIDDNRKEKHVQGRKRHVDGSMVDGGRSPTSTNGPTSEEDEWDHGISSGATNITAPDPPCHSDKEDEDVVVTVKKSRIENLLSDYRCTCCMEVAIMPTILIPCRHLFCFKCIENWVRTCQTQPATCPNCKQDIHERTVLPSSLADTIDFAVEVGLPVVEQNERQRITQKRQRCHNRFMRENEREVLGPSTMTLRRGLQIPLLIDPSNLGLSPDEIYEDLVVRQFGLSLERLREVLDADEDEYNRYFQQCRGIIENYFDQIEQALNRIRRADSMSMTTAIGSGQA